METRSCDDLDGCELHVWGPVGHVYVCVSPYLFIPIKPLRAMMGGVTYRDTLPSQPHPLPLPRPPCLTQHGE